MTIIISDKKNFLEQQLFFFILYGFFSLLYDIYSYTHKIVAIIIAKMTKNQHSHRKCSPFRIPRLVTILLHQLRPFSRTLCFLYYIIISAVIKYYQKNNDATILTTVRPPEQNRTNDRLKKLIQIFPLRQSVYDKQICVIIISAVLFQLFIVIITFVYYFCICFLDISDGVRDLKPNTIVYFYMFHIK